MPEPVFERYKEALKRGHLALQRGRHQEALREYRSAAELAGHRALPHVALGDVLLRLDRVDESLEAYALALERAPEDPAGLGGRAKALFRAGRPRESAGLLDRLADVHRASGRWTDAVESLGRALELAPSPERVHRLEEARAEMRGALDAEAAAAAPADPIRSETWLGAADTVTALTDVTPAVTAFTAAAERYAREGALDAALDACHRALAIAPGSAAVHLILGRLYLDRGWRDPAVEKLHLLERLIELDGDEGARAEFMELVRQRRDADPRLPAFVAEG